MGEWRTVDLAEVADDISYGYTESASDEPIGPKFLRITDIVSGTVNWARVPYCPINDKDLAKYRLIHGDIVIARTGATTGANYTVRESDPKDVVFASYLIRYRIDRTRALPEYVGYCLRSSLWSSFVEGVSGGSAQPGANAKVLGGFEFDLPDLPEQRAIASVLSSLDAKIDLLHRQNKTLEGMAEALFREWFVEKAEEGWEEVTLSSLGPIEMGNSPKGDSYNEVGEGVPLINGPVEYGDYFPLRSKWTTDPKRFAEAGDLIFCVRGSTTGRRVVADGEYAIGRGVCAFRSKQRMFLYQMIEAKLPDLLAQTTGSVFPSLSSDDIKNFPITLPPQKLRDQYEALAGPMLERIEANHRQCATLAALRDRLLPKLMSGEVRVEVAQGSMPSPYSDLQKM